MPAKSATGEGGDSTHLLPGFWIHQEQWSVEQSLTHQCSVTVGSVEGTTGLEERTAGKNSNGPVQQLGSSDLLMPTGF